MHDLDKLNLVTIKSYIGHRDDVTCCSFSSDWKLLATGGDDFTLRLWDMVKDKEVHALIGHTQHVKSVCFSYNNEKIASGGADNIVIVWQVSSGIVLNTLNGHALSIECVCFSNSGDFLCSGSWDYTAILWDLNTSSPIRILDEHKSVVQCCAFSLSGNMLATGSWDYAIRIYDIVEYTEHVLIEAQNRKQLRLEVSSVRNKNSKGVFKVLKFHKSNIKSVAFSCNDILASASWDCTLCLWDVNNGMCLHVLRGHDGFVQACAFSVNGKYLASASDDETVRVWCVETGELVKTLETYIDEILQLSFTEENTLLSSGPQQVSLCLY